MVATAQAAMATSGPRRTAVDGPVAPGAPVAPNASGISPAPDAPAAPDVSSAPGTSPAAGTHTIPAIRITRLHVYAARVVADVSLVNSVPHQTSCSLMARVLPEFPNLPKHACVNEHGRTFAAVMNATPVPHLLEHMVVDLQVRRSSTLETFVGTSEWVSEQDGQARIAVSFADDLVALAAFKEAVSFLNEALGQA